MTWLDFIFKRVDPAPPPAPVITFPRTTSNWGYVDPAQFLASGAETKQVDTIGDFDVLLYPDGTAAVRFETDCECLVTMGCINRDVATHVAGCLNRCMTHSSVDVGLDRI